LKEFKNLLKFHNVVDARRTAIQQNTAADIPIAPGLAKIAKLHNAHFPQTHSLPTSTVLETIWPTTKDANGTRSFFGDLWGLQERRIIKIRLDMYSFLVSSNSFLPCSLIAAREPTNQQFSSNQLNKSEILFIINQL